VGGVVVTLFALRPDGWCAGRRLWNSRAHNLRRPQQRRVAEPMKESGPLAAAGLEEARPDSLGCALSPSAAVASINNNNNIISNNNNKHVVSPVSAPNPLVQSAQPLAQRQREGRATWTISSTNNPNGMLALAI